MKQYELNWNIESFDYFCKTNQTLELNCNFINVGLFLQKVADNIN